MAYSDPPSGVQIESARAGDDHIIQVRGELDLASCPELEQTIRLAERTGAARIIIDVSGLDELLPFLEDLDEKRSAA